MVCDDFVFLHLMKDLIQPGKRFGVHILNTIAADAADMIMALRISIEPLLLAPHLQFLNHSGFGEDLEIPVHRTEADTGKPLTDHLVNLVCSGVGLYLP